MSELGESSSRRAAQNICQRALARKTAEERVEWALRTLPGEHIVSSSFGAQSAVMLHLMNAQKPGIPVVVIDTGYLFAETYRFIDELTAKLDLNLNVYRPRQSAAWQEARYGRRWEKGVTGLKAYNHDNKVEPMERALEDLGVGTWFAGVRRSQSAGRARTPFIDSSGERWKIHPIADWSDRDIYQYLKKHKLPYHPLWEKGYVSIGDVHTTLTLADAGSKDATRFFGLQRECGLHLMDYGNTA